MKKKILLVHIFWFKVAYYLANILISISSFGRKSKLNHNKEVLCYLIKIMYHNIKFRRNDCDNV